MSAPPRGADPLGYHVSTRTPMKFGGETVHQLVQQKRIQAPSIFKAPTPVAGDLPPRVNLPPENPKYPETKHTLKCAALLRLLLYFACLYSHRISPFSLSLSQDGHPQHQPVPGDGPARHRELRPGPPRREEPRRPLSVCRDHTKGVPRQSVDDGGHVDAACVLQQRLSRGTIE